MPEELRERLQEAAQETGRSMHAEIVHRLQQSFQPAVSLKRAEVADIVRATVAELQAVKKPRK